MNQPDLGKKIAELRKAKGFTQEELVEKCNLSVRTLQRIESGEVSPRSYTLKVIFAALDYDFYDSSEITNSKFGKTGFIISNWIGHLYAYVIDLFNLKTNKMKKLMILSVPLISICTLLLFFYSASVKAQSKMEIREKFEIASSNSRFMNLYNSGQIDSIGLLYLDSACLMIDLPSTINGRKAIADYYKQLYNQGLRFSNIKTISRNISDSFAVERGVWVLSLASVPIATGIFITQWHYINGQWYIENAISKTDQTISQEAYK
jgi:transcriptional regulator with XRE-family HTH domain